jgi:hypothetical protein
LEWKGGIAKGDGLTDIVKSGYRRVKDVLKGTRKHLPPSVRDYLAKYGTQQVIGMSVNRTPVFGIIQNTINVLSLGNWNKNKKKLNYDDVYHLYLLVTIRNGKTFRIEKNHVENMYETTEEGKDHINVHVPKGITLNDLFINGEKAAGSPEKFHVYDSIHQNCQRYVEAILKGIGEWTPEVSKFVLQDAPKLIEGSSWFGYVAKKITDLANVADVAVYGSSKSKSKLKK